MAASNTFASRLAILVVFTPLAIGAWYAAPYFLPVWRWQNMTEEKLAQLGGKSAEVLAKQYHIVFRCSERGPGDPVPWQLIEMKPAWDDGAEEQMLIRATIVSDRSGEPIGALSMGSGSYKDRYFQAQAWRFPPGSFGFNKHRPVVVFEHDTMTKLDIGRAMSFEEQVGPQKSPKWPHDDDAVEDGYTPPESP